MLVFQADGECVAYFQVSIGCVWLKTRADQTKTHSKLTILKTLQ